MDSHLPRGSRPDHRAGGGFAAAHGGVNLRRRYLHGEFLSSYAPLLLAGDHYLSTVTQLSRFAYSWRARVLDRQRRFQIRAGFIFEDVVKAALEKQGFMVQNIVRINRQEFDVVSMRDGIIWNVRCKNNFIDITRVDSDAVAFARYNRGLLRAYE